MRAAPGNRMGWLANTALEGNAIEAVKASFQAAHPEATNVRVEIPDVWELPGSAHQVVSQNYGFMRLRLTAQTPQGDELVLEPRYREPGDVFLSDG